MAENTEEKFLERVVRVYDQKREEPSLLLALVVCAAVSELGERSRLSNSWPHITDSSQLLYAYKRERCICIPLVRTAVDVQGGRAVSKY